MNIELVQHNFRSARPFKSIRSGSFILFTVKKAKGNGLYSVLLNGKTVDVKSASALTPGVRYKALLVKHSNGIELRLAAKGNPVDNSLNCNMYLSLSGIEKDIAESLVGSSLALNDANIKLIKDALKYLKKKDRNSIRLLSIMLEKEIPLNGITIGELFKACYGYEKNEDNREDPYDNNGRKDLEDSIKSYILRNDGSMDLLKYFNHKKGRNDNWLVIPFRYTYGSEFGGVLRVHLDNKGNLLGFNMEIDGKGNWQFQYKKRKSDNKIGIYSDSYRASKWFTAKLAELNEKLHKKGIEIDDIKKESLPFEDFPSDKGYIGSGIDAVV